MLRVIGLLSSSLLTQLVLVATQFVLLPIQLAKWGHEATADWYAGLAVAAIATVADAGFRTLGHDALLVASRDTARHDERERFLQCWAIVRGLVVAVSLALVVGNFLGSLVSAALPFTTWRMLLILAFGVETLIVVRIVYMDSLGLYNRAEVTYLAVVTARLILSVVAVVMLDGREIALAAVYLASSVIGLVLQERSCARIPLLRMSAWPNKLPSRRLFAEARFTVAEPLTNWVRQNMPVLIIVTIGNAYAVTTFVALRTLFGGLRNLLVQVARAGSVEYLRLRSRSQSSTATDTLRAFLITGTCVAAAFGAAVIIDDYTLLRLWLRDLDRVNYRLVADCLAVGAIFYPYQLLANIRMRQGAVPDIATRQYGWMIFVAVLVAIAVFTQSLTFYVVSLAISDVAIGLLFYCARMDRELMAAARTGLMACIGCVAIVIVIGVARNIGVLPGMAQAPGLAIPLFGAIVAVLAIGPATSFARLIRRAKVTV